jgi:septal ring factor EnvC (AmiA/AmiB activator)
MMSNEELERIMNFIVKRQEYATEQIARLTESQTRFDEALSRLAEQQGDHEERIARFERSYVRIAQLLEKHDGQLDAVTEGLNNVTDGLAKLTTLVTRYIAARGDGSNGGA